MTVLLAFVIGYIAGVVTVCLVTGGGNDGRNKP